MAPATSTTPAVEVWKDIEGFEGFYQVSTKGRVRSLDRHIDIMTKYGTIIKRFCKGYVLIAQTQYGYLLVGLKKNGKVVRTLVHRLVAKAFIPNPDDLPQVNHKDENKLNNCADNLEWCDGKYNANYGTGKWRSVAHTSKRVEQLTLQGEHVAFFTSQGEAGRHIGCAPSCIRRSCKNAHFTSHGYRWRYVNN